MKKRKKTEQRMKESAGNCLVLLWRSLVLVRMPPRIKTTSRCVQRKCPPLRPSHGLHTGLPTTPWVKLCFTASCLSGMCQGFSFRGNRMQSFRTIVLNFFPVFKIRARVTCMVQTMVDIPACFFFYFIFILLLWVWEMYGTSGLCLFLVIDGRWEILCS